MDIRAIIQQNPDVEFDGMCPWCGARPEMKLIGPCAGAECACGAVALGDQDFEFVWDEARNYFHLMPGGLESPSEWRERYGIEVRDGGRGPSPVPNWPMGYTWFRRQKT